ncbi:MAG: hypothetical protein U0625_06970 [Phycisphaerales bacterium]
MLIRRSSSPDHALPRSQGWPTFELENARFVRRPSMDTPSPDDPEWCTELEPPPTVASPRERLIGTSILSLVCGIAVPFSPSLGAADGAVPASVLAALGFGFALSAWRHARRTMERVLAACAALLNLFWIGVIGYAALRMSFGG